MKISFSDLSITLFTCICLLFCSGCPSETKPIVLEPENAMTDQQIEELVNRPLKVLAVGQEQWGEEIVAQYTGRYESKIEVTSQAVTDFNERKIESLSEFDVLIVPPSCIASLAEDNLLYEIRPESLQRFHEESLLSADREIGRYGGKVIGVSLGLPLRMLYHSDSPLAAAYLASNQSWSDWHKLAVEHNRDSLQFIEPFAGTGAAESLLARGGSYARSRTQVAMFFNRSNGSSRIDSVPFVTALEEMKQEYSAHVEQLKGISNIDAMAMLRDSKAAAGLMKIENLTGVDWPVGKATSNQEQTLNEFSPTNSSQLPTLEGWSVAQVPFADRYYNLFSQQWSEDRSGDQHRYQLIGLHGRVACVLQSTRKIESSLRLLEILSNSPTAETIAGFASDIGPAKVQQLEQLPQWFGKAYSADALEAIRYAYQFANESQGASLLRFPATDGHTQKLSMLNQAVLDVLEGRKPAEEALKQCAADWDQWETEHQNRVELLISRQ